MKPIKALREQYPGRDMVPELPEQEMQSLLKK